MDEVCERVLSSRPLCIVQTTKPNLNLRQAVLSILLFVISFGLYNNQLIPL